MKYLRHSDIYKDADVVRHVGVCLDMKVNGKSCEQAVADDDAGMPKQLTLQDLCLPANLLTVQQVRAARNPLLTPGGPSPPSPRGTRPSTRTRARRPHPQIIAIVDFGENKVSTSGDFTVTWNAAGIINIT